MGDESFGIMSSAAGTTFDAVAYQGIVRRGAIVLVVRRIGDVDADYTADDVRSEWLGIVTTAVAKAEDLG